MGNIDSEREASQVSLIFNSMLEIVRYVCLNCNTEDIRKVEKEHWRGFKGWEISRCWQNERKNSILEGKFNWTGRWEKRTEEHCREGWISVKAIWMLLI